MIFGLAIIVGLAAGWLRGGGMGALGDLRARWWPLAVGAGAVHVTLRAWHGLAPDHGVQLAASVATYAAFAVFLVANRAIPGALLGLAGMLANFAAILWGGGRMPVWTAALYRVPGWVGREVTGNTLASHVAMAHPSGLGWLGDVLVIPRPLPGDVFSVGDLLLALALVAVIAGTMAPRRPAG